MGKVIFVFRILGYFFSGVGLYYCLHVFQLGWWTVLIGMSFATAGVCFIGAEGLKNAFKGD